MTTTQPLRFGTTGTAGCWTGVIRRGSRIVVICGHTHSNRDYGNASARDCIRSLVWTVRQDRDAHWIGMASAAAHRAASLGARLDVERAVTRAQATLDAARASGALTEQVNGTGYNGTVPAVR
jgi:hypothetical protein